MKSSIQSDTGANMKPLYITIEQFIKLKDERKAKKIFLGRGKLITYMWYEYNLETSNVQYLYICINELCKYFETVITNETI